jgi:hypothetical protein
MQHGRWMQRTEHLYNNMYLKTLLDMPHSASIPITCLFTATCYLAE